MWPMELIEKELYVLKEGFKYCRYSWLFPFSALTMLIGCDRKGILPVKNWLLVCCWWRSDELCTSFSFAPVITTTSINLSCNKIQSGDVLVPANPDPSGKWPLKLRERERGIHGCHVVDELTMSPGLSCSSWIYCWPASDVIWRTWVDCSMIRGLLRSTTFINHLETMHHAFWSNILQRGRCLSGSQAADNYLQPDFLKADFLLCICTGYYCCVSNQWLLLRLCSWQWYSWCVQAECETLEN